MQQKAALCVVLLLMAQQVVVGAEPSRVLAVRRVARMSPLWRILNSKPAGAYCQNDFECSAGRCRTGRCSAGRRSPSEAVSY